MFNKKWLACEFIFVLIVAVNADFISDYIARGGDIIIQDAVINTIHIDDDGSGDGDISVNLDADQGYTDSADICSTTNYVYPSYAPYDYSGLTYPYPNLCPYYLHK